MSKVIYAVINFFDAQIKFMLEDEVIAETSLGDINEVLTSLCSTYKVNKVHLFGPEQFINGLINPTNYNNIEIEVN